MRTQFAVETRHGLLRLGMRPPEASSNDGTAPACL
jgi:hypothetical protein